MAEISKESPDIVDKNLRKIRESFPSCVTEGRIDFKKLRNLLGDNLTSGEDTKPFSWAGRADGLKALQTTTKGTLVPDGKESVNFDETENIFVEGDNLEVMKLLQKSYSGKIKMIYIDPPYNTGNDFVYNDDFKDSIEGYLEQTGQAKGGVRQTTNPETSGRFHADWLTMMYPRLSLANDLLKEDGIIFVSIGMNEFHNLKILLNNEIFGEENFICDIVWQKKFSRQSDATFFSDNHEYILCYAKNRSAAKINLLPRTEKQDDRYKNSDNDPRGPWAADNLIAKSYSSKYDFPIITPSGRKVNPPHGYCWRSSKERLDEMIKDNRIWFGKDGNNVPRIKRFLKEVQSGVVPTTLWLREEAGDTQEAVREFKDLMKDAKFDNPKPTKLIKQMINLATLPSNGDLILDFFAGSGTTGQAIMEQNLEDNGNRKLVLIQLPEKSTGASAGFNKKYPTIADIGKERLRQTIKKIKEESKQQKLAGTKQDLGFKVFRLAKSNYRIWEDYDGKDADELKKQAELFSKPLVDGYDDTDVIYEVIVKEGYGLNSRIEKVDVSTNMVYRVTDADSSFFITLDAKIDAKTLDGLDLSKDTTLVCIDDSLDDSQKNNISMRCNLKTI